MPCLITALSRSTIKKTTREKHKQQNRQKVKTFFTAKIQHLYLKAHSNNIKINSDQTLTHKFNFLVTTQQIGFYVNETS